MVVVVVRLDILGLGCQILRMDKTSVIAIMEIQRQHLHNFLEPPIHLNHFSMELALVEEEEVWVVDQKTWILIWKNSWEDLEEEEEGFTPMEVQEDKRGSSQFIQ